LRKQYAPVGNTVEFTIDRDDGEIKIGMAFGERPE
jgi:hypothetical protein